MCRADLFDERTAPGFPAGLLAEERFSRLYTAVAYLPLGRLLELSDALVRPDSIALRVVSTRVAATDWHEEARRRGPGLEARRGILAALTMIRSGRLHVRAAPLAEWQPDFAVAWRDGAPSLALLGLPDSGRSHLGPHFTTRLEGPCASHTAWRFQELWSSAHEVTSGVERLLVRVGQRYGAPGASSPRRPKSVDTLRALG